MMVLSLFIIDLMGLFFYTKIGSIRSIGDLPTTEIIEPLIELLSIRKAIEIQYFLPELEKIRFLELSHFMKVHKNGIIYSRVFHFKIFVLFRTFIDFYDIRKISGELDY